MIDPRRFAEATQRNREPILAVLARHARPGARILEIASGTGEHAVFLAPALDVAWWQPTDPDPAARASIDAWRSVSADPRVRPASKLDVRTDAWPEIQVDLVVCINMLHIAPWEACPALMRGAARALGPGGKLFLYGPYVQDGVATAPSNVAFDASLRGRDPSWGLRRLEAVVEAARAEGLELAEVVEMPANNLSVVLAGR